MALVLVLPLNLELPGTSAVPASVISTISGANSNERFGWNVSDCGDVNGDGFEDVIVGAPGYNGGQGRAYIFFGGPGFTGNLIAENADVILNGSYPNARFGWDVSGAGDFNGDGINDTIVGAPKNNSDTGAAYIFYGSVMLGGAIGSINADISIDGEKPGDLFGGSVSELGDVSKENPVNHIVISEVYANAVDETSPNIGEYMELYNPTSSPVILDNWVIEDMDTHSFTLAGTIPAYGFYLIAIDNYQASSDPVESSWPAPDFDCGYTAGSVFANAGDEVRLKDDTGAIIDTFGYGSSAEWYEGAYHPSVPNPWESYERKLGETVPNGGNAIDTDDNANDFSIRASAEPQNSASAPEIPPVQSFFDDVIIGAPGYGNDRGRAYIYFGSSGIADLASDADIILTGEADNHLFGFSVSGAWDVNADSFDDIIIGAPGYDNNRGKSYVYYGAQDMLTITQDMKFAHWDESDNAVADNVYPIQNNQMLGQSFTPDNDYLITKVSAYIEGGSTNPSRSITFELQGDTGGAGPDGVTMAASGAYNRVLSQPTWVEFEFSTPFQASSGTKYWMVAISGSNPANQWLWTEDETAGTDYPGGNGAFYGGGVWVEDPPESDYWFKAYGKLPASPDANITLFGGAQNDLFGWSTSELYDVGGDGFGDIIIGAPGTVNGNAYLINGSGNMQDVTAAGSDWGNEKQVANWESGGDYEPAVYTGQYIAQSFTSTEILNLTKVSLYIETYGTPGALTISLQGSTGVAPDTIPDGIVLAQAPPISTGNVTYEWTDFVWNTPYVTSTGMEYFIVAQGTGADTSNCWAWYAQNTGTYPTGDTAFDLGSGWNASTTDFYFRAYGNPRSVPPDITLSGESPGDMFGYSVSGAGNFNGDPNDDIVIGAPYSGNGKIYIFNGSDSMSSVISGAVANYTVSGEGPGDCFGRSVSMARDVNTTAGNFEVIVGAPYRDPGGVGDAGRAYIISRYAVPPLPLPVDLPFRINSDAEFAALAASEGWSGDGSAGNPYIIEDYDIDGGGYGYCIYIGNTTVSFVIRNSTFYNSSGNPGNYFWNSGVALFNAPNGTLSANTFENCTGDSIYLNGASNISITQNTIMNSTSSGIYMESSVGNFMDDNIFDNNNYAIEMRSNSDSNTITDNTFTNNSEALDLWACDNNLIADNIGYDNGMFAYLFGGCNGNEFINNTITDSGTGIYLQTNCDGNTFQNNIIFNLSQEGIILESSDSNIMDSNDIQKCREGIYTILALLNVISNNTLSNNSNNGIYLDPGSDQNTVSNNTISFNGDEGILMISADLNIIFYNDIFNNTLYGVNVSTGTDNEIHHNTFDDNNKGYVQANDDGTNNIWDDGSGEGNLWGDYENRYLPPASSDGKVWDIPYDINGSAGAQDLYPLALYPWYQDLRINNNTEFAETAAFFGWAGDGSSGDPYIIEGLTIDGGGLGYGIYIGNTTANFIIRNCSIENSTGNSDQYSRNSGIYLYNATNGTLDNNDIKACGGNGINIEYSTDIVVSDNTVRNNDMSGIYTGYYSNITISDNTCSFNNWSGVWLWSTSDSFVMNNTLLNNTDGITLEWSDGNSIIDNNCTDNADDGIYVANSEYNTLVNNTCINNEDGIYVSASDNNSIIDNICLNNSDNGIGLSNADYNAIFNNTVVNNNDGIWLSFSHNNTIESNSCSNNLDGIDFDRSNYNDLVDNTLKNNFQEGMDFNQSSNNTLVGNDCINNTNNGIELSFYCNDTIIRNNTITGNNNDGISMDIGNSQGIIENNTIRENGRNGIYLILNSDGFIIIYNVIANNTEYGIQIRDNDCDNSLIHHNGFFFNNGTGVQAYDNGSNMWDDGYPSGGNFWSDYIGVDFNGTATQDVPPPDGFGDTPYDTVGPKGARDRYPLITFPWSLPPPSGLPGITNVMATPDPQETGGLVNISCNVTDPDGVKEVWVNITLPSGAAINVSMTNGSGSLWYDDSIYSILGPYDYVIWAKDGIGVWNSSSGYTFTIQDTTAPFIFNVQNLPSPQEVGGSTNITCEVTDNVGVYGVWLNVSYPTGGFTNVSMTKGAGNEWYYESVYLILGGYSHMIWANDTSNNWVVSMNNNFQIRDTTPPAISSVLDAPDPQLPGDFVNITCDVTDNLAVYGVWVNITLPGGGSTNVSMDKGAGGEWFLDSSYIPTGIYNYEIWVNDTEDNWASSSGHSFLIDDPDPPVISNVLDGPDPQIPGGFVNISCDVTDDVEVYGVRVNITLPGGGSVNVSMSKGAGDAWYLDSLYITLGLYDYVIWANDTSNNWVGSSGHQFTIQDTTIPVISNVLDAPDPQEVGGNVNITCDVTDNAGVFEVWMNMSIPGGGFVNITMTKGFGDSWYHNSAYPISGIYNYEIWANDTTDNWAASSGHSFLIQDTTIPVISNVMDTPDPQGSGGSVNVSCDVTDNVNVFGVWINISLPGGGSSNISMNYGAGVSWYLDSAYLPLGVYDYTIWANDTENNWASASGFLFTIQDTIPPEITNVVADPDPQIVSLKVNLSCDVQDDFGISQVWVNITRPDMSFINISMEKGSGNSWFNDSIYTILGTHDYVIWAWDNSGNWNSSSGHSFEIQTGPPHNIILISGNGQTDFVGSQLAMPLVVEVRDEFGNTISNADVWFNITSGGGSLSGPSPLSTDTNGRARIFLTLGAIIGTNSVAAEISGGGISQVIFTSIATAGAPYDIVIISGNGQSADVDSQLPGPFIVEVRDRFGNIVSNTEVWFNVTVGSGYLDSSSLQITDAMGRAQVNLTLGTQTGPNTVTSEIASSGINQVIFDANAHAASPYNIIIISGNGQTDVVGAQLPAAFVVEVTDRFGNKVNGSEVWFNVTSGNGVLDGTSPILTGLDGRASITLTLGPDPGSNTVSAEITGQGQNSVTFLATGASNEPEIISKIDNIGLQEDDPPLSLFLFASAIDDDDLPTELKWYITDYDPTLYSISGQGTNILVIIPEPDRFGNDEVTLMVVDKDGLSDSYPLWINITPVNDKPFFFPEPPDLTVTKDLPYTFSYAPYLIDIDNTMAELVITTDSPSYTAVSGHLITFLYPEAMVNQQQFVTLTLSDGTDSTQAVIQVNVTEDRVPVLNKELPDVTLFEGEIKYNVFDLDDYFYDPDGDSVFFSYGYSRISIIINEDHSVDFSAEGDWNGEEVVTFRARDPNYAIVEDTITVTVLPVNDPPSISGVPDLVVHYDNDYIFDLTPYIMDADNLSFELELSFMESSGSSWLVSENVNASSDNNLRMLINYPKTLLGTTFKVRIIVFDGIDFASQVINITVSENWQPELEKNISDVVFYEDEYVTDEFNLNDYFTDRDNDALFFTYGQKHIKVRIHENGSVDFHADENWFGTENITIRATDPSGAIVEDIITVSVIPVNDPPRISQIPDQEGFVGVTWVLDISSYIHDDDNNLTELEIYTESPYVTVVGSVLVFQYPNDIREDSVYVLVLDPTNSNADTTFNVTIKEAPKIGSGTSDIMPFVWLSILIIIIMVTLLLLYIYTSGKYAVEEVLLVYRNKGILIARVNQGEEEKMDRDLMTGMFTAIQDFVGDVFESDGQDATQLKEMELGNKKVLIEHGQYTYIAAVFKGRAARLAPKLKSTLVELETEFIDILEDWDGEIEAFEGVEVHLGNLMKY